MVQKPGSAAFSPRSFLFRTSQTFEDSFLERSRLMTKAVERGLRDQVSRHGQIPNIQPVETRLREVTQSKESDFGALVLVYLC